MCEYPAIIEQHKTVARKAHRCSECRRTIKPGEIVFKTDQLFDGRWCHDKFCQWCQAAWEALWREGHEFACEIPIGEMIYALVDATNVSIIKEQPQ